MKTLAVIFSFPVAVLWAVLFRQAGATPGLALAVLLATWALQAAGLIIVTRRGAEQ